MDIGHFVPKQIRDYYHCSESDPKENGSLKEFRKPYKTVSEKGSTSKIPKKDKRMTQQFILSRNRDQFPGFGKILSSSRLKRQPSSRDSGVKIRSNNLQFNPIVQPLMDITQNETNKISLLDSLESQTHILSDEK